jgi:endonuclease/exonuclease/phosphatase family metal-dependent hydrolase
MSRFRFAAACLVSSLSVVACIAPTDATDGTEDAVTSAGTLKLATFNAGLVRGGVALVDERLPNLAPALEATGADVLCLQEVWGDQDYEALRAALAPTYPNAFRQRTVEDGHQWFACGPFKLNSLKGCVDSACTPNGVSAEECVQKACKDKYDALSDDCKICLAANTDSPTSCIFRAPEYVQGGRNGVALFSKLPIEDAHFEDYGTALVHRGMIRATIAGRAIACTHLSSDLTTVPYPSGQPWSSWKEEQAAQIDKVVASLPPDGCRIVMGDLNASQATNGSIRPELDSTLAGFSAKGLREPWESPVCTWCPPPANPLASGQDEKQYDHVLTAGCGAPKYRRILDQPITVQHAGQTLETRLSDHFGLMAEIPR